MVKKPATETAQPPDFVKPAQVQSALRFHFQNLQLLFNFLQPYFQSFLRAFVVVIDNGFRDGRVAQVPLQGGEQVQRIAAGGATSIEVFGDAVDQFGQLQRPRLGLQPQDPATPVIGIQRMTNA